MRLDIAGYDYSRSDVEDETMMPRKRLASTTMKPELTGTNHHTRSISILFLQRRLGVFLASVNTRHGTPSPIAVQTPFFSFFVYLLDGGKLVSCWEARLDTNKHLFGPGRGIVIPTTNNIDNLTDFCAHCSFFLSWFSALFLRRHPLVCVWLGVWMRNC